MPRYIRRWWGVGLVVVLVTGLYVATVGRYATGFGDSDELVTVGFLGGVAHPPGYPLLMLLTYLATHVPLGNVAARAHVFNALVQTAAVGMWFLCWWRMRARKPKVFEAIILVGLSITVAVARDVWLYANTLEVFALNHFLTGLSVWASILLNEKLTWRRWIGWWVAVTFMVWHHQLSLLVLPGLVVWVWPTLSQVWRRKRVWWWAISIVFLGALGHFLALTFLDSRNAPVSWRFEPSFPSWWRMVSRADFGGVFVESGDYQGAWWSGFDWQRGFAHLKWYIQDYLWHQWGGVGGVFVVLSLIGAWWVNRRWALGWWLSVFLTGPLLSMYAGFDPYDVVTRAITERMYIYGVMIQGLGMGMAATFLTSKRKEWSIVVAVVVIGNGVWQATGNFRAVKLSEYTVVERAVEDHVEAMQPNALYLCFSDVTCFASLYLHTVNKVRSDLTIVPVTPQLRDDYLVSRGELGVRWYRDNPFRVGETVGRALATNRAVYASEMPAFYGRLWGTGSFWGLSGGQGFVQVGCDLPELQVYPLPETFERDFSFFAVHKGIFMEPVTAVRGVCPALTPVLRGVATCEDRGDTSCVLQQAYWATLVDQDSVEAHLVLARAYEASQNLELAKREYHVALNLDPQSIEAGYALVRLSQVAELQ